MSRCIWPLDGSVVAGVNDLHAPLIRDRDNLISCHPNETILVNRLDSRDIKQSPDGRPGLREVFRVSADGVDVGKCPHPVDKWKSRAAVIRPRVVPEIMHADSRDRILESLERRHEQLSGMVRNLEGVKLEIAPILSVEKCIKVEIARKIPEVPERLEARVLSAHPRTVRGVPRRHRGCRVQAEDSLSGQYVKHLESWHLREACGEVPTIIPY